MLHVFVGLELEVMERLLESASCRARVIRLERDERLPAHVRDLLEVLQRSVCLVRRHFADLESLARFRDKRNELRGVRRVLVENPNGRDDVRLHAARDMCFYPYAFLTCNYVFLIVPSLEFRA